MDEFFHGSMTKRSIQLRKTLESNISQAKKNVHVTSSTKQTLLFHLLAQEFETIFTVVKIPPATSML